MDNEAGFVELFRREHPGLVRELTLILGDRLLAEDVGADAFAELWRKWSAVGSYDRPGAWVRRVALRNAGRARWRRHRRVSVEASFIGSRSADSLDLDLVTSLAQLSEAQRIALVMHHLGGWPAAEIAVVIGCAEVTVRTHLHRGRHRLAELLRDTTPLEVNDGES